jgi:hypothetical protein
MAEKRHYKTRLPDSVDKEQNNQNKIGNSFRKRRRPTVPELPVGPQPTKAKAKQSSKLNQLVLSFVAGLNR